jgi:enoyl-CoA hydratase/carnithine racemase
VVLTYTRPPENVIGFADLAELDEALATWADEDRTQVIMLTGGCPDTLSPTPTWLMSTR